MTVPAFQIYDNGPIAVTGDNLNTFVSTLQTADQLRNYTGRDGMAVLLQGIATVNDSHGGLFYWNGAATAPDDNLDVIVPFGTTPGAWLRLILQVVD